MKKEVTSELENREDASACLNCHQPTEASENRGLVLISALAPDYIEDESEYEYRECVKWYKAGEELESILDNLRHYDALDCRISLAEYSEPKHDIEHIEQIRTFIVYIPHNENFYFWTTEEASDSLLEHCRESGLPTPTRIDYVIDGYFMLWELKRGLTKKELPVWEFIQRKLHRTFEDIGADAKIAQDSTAMIYAPDFGNSAPVGFDLSDTIKTVYCEEAYLLPYDFVFSLTLSVSEIEEYRNTRAKKILHSCDRIALTKTKPI